jgi:4-hydroxy-2-oxoheptanedioate aldolase
MNKIELEMVDRLADLKEHHGVTGIKAEFEAEGTRIEEAMRLKDVVGAAGLGLTLKIGGCEAIRDMYEARVLGVARIVAPMIESAYALSKFLKAIDFAFPEGERERIRFAINIETGIAYHSLDAILSAPGIEKLDGVVIGRVDLSGSIGLGRDDINAMQVFDISRDILAKCKKRGLHTAIGGGVSADSLPLFREFPAGHLDLYETRKVMFACPEALGPQAEEGILKAVYFELLWLKNKRDFYGTIFAEDAARIDMLEHRYRHAMAAQGICP